MDEAFATWTVIEKTDDDEFRKPTKMKQIKKSVLLIDQVIGMCPTDADVIERLNSLTDVINSGEERHFGYLDVLDDGSRYDVFYFNSYRFVCGSEQDASILN